MSDGSADEFGERVLVLAPTARDAVATQGLLADAGIRCLLCATIADVCREAARGAGVALVTAEAVVGDAEGLLAALLRAQPPWSDLPLIVLTPHGEDSPRLIQALESVGPVSLLKRPVQVSMLVSAVRAALRDRRRQYAVRDLLAERERAAEELRAEREQYRVTLSSIGDAVVATDTAGNVTFLNPVAEGLTGWAIGAARGRPLEDVFRIVNESSRRPVENPARRALDEGVIVGLANHTILVARDGTEYPIDDSAAPIRSRDAVTGAVLVFRDITERKKAETEREHLTETLRLALDAGDLGTWDWDPATDAMVLSERAGDVYGVEPGRPHRREQLRELLHPDHRDRARREAARAAAEGTDYGIEYPLVNGRWVAAHGRGVYGPDGGLTRMIGVVQDVTARKGAEAALRESEGRHRALVTATSEVVYRMSADWQVMHPLGGRGLVPSSAEAIRGWMHINLPAFEHPRVWEAIHEAIRTKRPFEMEHRVNRADGSIGWTVSRAVPILDAGGAIVEWFGTARDVTERRRIEDELRDIRSRMEAALEAAAIGTWSWDVPADRFHGDASLARIFGVAPEVVAGGPIAGLMTAIHPDDRDRVSGLVARAMEADERYEADYRVHQPNGSWRWVTARGQVERDASGRAVRFPGVVIDVTDRKRAEEDLARVTAESERRKRLYETVLSATPDFVYVFTLDHRVLYANDALVAMWGRGREGAIGRTFLEIGYEPWHAALHDREIDTVRETKQPIRGEVPFTGTHGRRIYDYIFVPVFGADGEVEAVAGTTRDVTDRKVMEDALREADRKKDDFIALLAHELRNPLAPIRNGLQVVRLSRDRAVQERSQAMMDRQLAHMVRLIDDLLDVSRIGRNKMELRRARVPLADVVNSAVETARPMIDEAGHELFVVLPPRPVFLDADLTRLSQVFSNLLTNSAKYTERGGQIWLSAEARNGTVAVSVRDTGTGIPAPALPRIFDMFSQVDRPTERSAGGLGIGLALVKGLVEMHGGTVSARSEGQGLGSEFTVTLPVPGEQPVPVVPAEGAPVESSVRRRILVVDDNRDGAESLALMLELLGSEIMIAYDGLEAVDRAEQLRPEIILMDVGMPKLDGLEATKRIRERPWGKAIKVIALTGWGQEADRERSRAAGCDGHLVKPVNLPDLEKLLAELIDG